MPDGLRSQYYDPSFKKALELTMQQWCSGTVESGRVGPNRQKEISSLLCSLLPGDFCSCSWQGDRWREIQALVQFQRCFLRKMCFGLYIGPHLPAYFITEFNAIECPRWKLFFIRRVLVYHNHLHSRIKVKIYVKTGILDYSANLKAKPKEFFSFSSTPIG